MESTRLGTIELDNGVMDTVFEHEGVEIPLRLEIDAPEAFDEKVVMKIDLALGGFAPLDLLARELITTAAGRATSAAAQLLTSWRQNILFGSDDSPEAFIRALRPVHVTLLPDGGKASLDRLVVLYASAEVPTSKIAVRFKEGIGPELDPALRS
jgi:hypothetical protein